MIKKEQLDDWKNRLNASYIDVYNLAKLNGEITLAIAEHLSNLHDSGPRDTIHLWFDELLDDIETWERAPMQSVLNDFGKIKAFSNQLIDYWDNNKK